MINSEYKSRQSRQEGFNNWMRETIQNVYYFHNERMCEAFERVE